MTPAVVFNVQRFSLHDGPGLRTTIFLKGCPLRCAWCHNPESWDGRTEVALHGERCLACGACRTACPAGIAGPLGSPTPGAETAGTCLRCGVCASVCPGEARLVVGRRADVADLLEEVRRDIPYYGTTGGVTISGGEPLSATNAPFTLAFLEACRDMRLATALDTCGHVDPHDLATAAELADLVLYDVKLIDADRHRAATGVDNARILANLQSLSAAGAVIRLRVPLVPGVNDDDANLDALAEFVGGLTRRHPVHLLPYHRTAQDKYRRLGLAFPLADRRPHTPEQRDAAADRLRRRGVLVADGE